MYLTKIIIHNFRKLQNVDLTLNRGLNLIVGENNSGKTTLIDAVRYTLDTNSAEWIRITENDSHEDARETKQRRREEKNILSVNTPLNRSLGI